MRSWSRFGGLALAALLAACDGSGIGGSLGPVPTTDIPLTHSDIDGTKPDLDILGDSDVGPRSDTPIGDVDAADPTDLGPDIPVVPADWLVKTLGVSGPLSAVHALDDTRAYAVGGPSIYSVRHGVWTVMGMPGGSDAVLHDVWADSGRVTVVGNDGLIATKLDASTVWTVPASGIDEDLWAVSGRGADGDMWVMGNSGTILRGDPQAANWTVAATGSQFDIRGIWVSPVLDGLKGIAGVGTAGRLWETDGADGFTSRQIASPQIDLHGIWGNGDQRVAVGDSGWITAKKGVGALWKGEISNDPDSRTLYAVEGASLQALTLAGANGVLIARVGDKWTVGEIVGPQNKNETLVDLALTPSSGVAVTDSGGALRLVSGQWVDETTRPEGGLVDFAGAPNGARGLWAVGPKGLIMNADDAGWTTFDMTGSDLHGVALAEDGVVWTVGAGGVIHSITAGGASVDFDLSVPLDLYGVATFGDTVLVVGKGGSIYRRKGNGTFVPVSGGGVGNLRAAVMGGDGAPWIVGAQGRVLHGESDGSFTVLPSGVGGTLHALAATEYGALAVGDNGVILELRPTGVTKRNEAPGLFLYGVSHAAGVGYAVGWNGAVLRVDTATVAPEVSGTKAVLGAVWHDATGAMIVGRQGVLLERLEAP